MSLVWVSTHFHEHDLSFELTHLFHEFTQHCLRAQSLRAQSYQQNISDVTFYGVYFVHFVDKVDKKHRKVESRRGKTCHRLCIGVVHCVITGCIEVVHGGEVELKSRLIGGGASQSQHRAGCPNRTVEQPTDSLRCIAVIKGMDHRHTTALPQERTHQQGDDAWLPACLAIVAILSICCNSVCYRRRQRVYLL